MTKYILHLATTIARDSGRQILQNKDNCKVRHAINTIISAFNQLVMHEVCQHMTSEAVVVIIILKAHAQDTKKMTKPRT